MQSFQTFKRGDRTLSECFEVFSLMHKVIENEDVLYRITCEVVQDFAKDGVVYAELRTTPRPLPPGNSARSYVDTVLRAFRTAPPTIVLRLLLSVDRTRGLDVADATVRLAQEYVGSGGGAVVGVDFSGNPTVGSFVDYAPAFALARAAGLGVTVHTGEVLNAPDTDFILETFRPDRLGHAVLLASAAPGRSRLISRPADRTVRRRPHS